MTTKNKMRELIDEVKSNSEDFLMNECNGVDLLTDAVNDYIDKMNKKQLTILYEKAKEEMA